MDGLLAVVFRGGRMGVEVWTYRAESLEIFLFWMKVWREGIAIT